MIRLVAYITIICWLALIGSGRVLYESTPTLCELAFQSWPVLRWVLYAAAIVILAGGIRDGIRSLRSGSNE